MTAITNKFETRLVTRSRIDEIDFNNIPFGKVFADHMLVAENTGGKWSDPVIQPYEKMEVAPSLTVLHYAQSIFEGMKAFKDQQGNPMLFRPEDNFRRMNKSARRMCMPDIPQSYFIDGLKELVSLDRNWIPTTEGSALYLRPFMYAMDEYIGIRSSGTYKFIIFTCPVGAYYADPVRLIVERDLVRAWPGGTGDVKTAGNYGNSLLGTKRANDSGYHNVLWLDGPERKYIEESGTMNIAFVIDGKVVTPELSGTILAGITRDSLLTLFRDMGVPVEERRITIDEVAAAHESGKLQEAFGMGTAATVAPVSTINLDGRDLNLPAMEKRTLGPEVLRRLNAIRTGTAPDTHNWMVKL